MKIILKNGLIKSKKQTKDARGYCESLLIICSLYIYACHICAVAILASLDSQILLIFLSVLNCFCRLSHNKIKSQGIMKIFEFLSGWSDGSVEEIDVSDNELDDLCIESFAYLINAKNNITLINLSSNNITDRGIAILEQSVSHKSRLKCLNLSGNNAITDKSLHHLENLMMKLKMKEVIVTDTQMTMQIINGNASKIANGANEIASADDDDKNQHEMAPTPITKQNLKFQNILMNYAMLPDTVCEIRWYSPSTSKNLPLQLLRSNIVRKSRNPTWAFNVGDENTSESFSISKFMNVNQKKVQDYLEIIIYKANDDISSESDSLNHFQMLSKIDDEDENENGIKVNKSGSNANYNQDVMDEYKTERVYNINDVLAKDISLDPDPYLIPIHQYYINPNDLVQLPNRLSDLTSISSHGFPMNTLFIADKDGTLFTTKQTFDMLLPSQPTWNSIKLSHQINLANSSRNDIDEKDLLISDIKRYESRLSHARMIQLLQAAQRIRKCKDDLSTNADNAMNAIHNQIETINSVFTSRDEHFDDDIGEKGDDHKAIKRIFQSEDQKKIDNEINAMKERIRARKELLQTRKSNLLHQAMVLNEKIKKSESVYQEKKNIEEESRNKSLMMEEQRFLILKSRKMQLIARLGEIYPLTLSSDGHKIRGLLIPPVFGAYFSPASLSASISFFSRTDEDKISTSLGYLAHLVLMISKYLDVPLRFSIRGRLLFDPVGALPSSLSGLKMLPQSASALSAAAVSASALTNGYLQYALIPASFLSASFIQQEASWPLKSELPKPLAIAMLRWNIEQVLYAFNELQGIGERERGGKHQHDMNLLDQLIRLLNPDYIFP